MDLKADMATHFLVFGLARANFTAADLSDPGQPPIPVEGEGLRAVTSTKEDFDILWTRAFPNSASFDDREFQVRLALTIQQWVKHKRVNPMLLDEETAGIRWILLKMFPGLRQSENSILFKMASFVAPGKYDLNTAEVEHLIHVLRLNSFGAETGRRLPVTRERGDIYGSSIGAIDRRMGAAALSNYGEDLDAKTEQIKRNNRLLANLIIEYKMKQLDWEKSKPRLRLNSEGANELYFPETDEYRKAAEKKVISKRKRVDEEIEQYDRVSRIPVPVKDSEVPILNSIVATAATRLRIVSSELEEAEREVKRAKLMEEQKIRAWDDFMRVREELGEAYLAALPIALPRGKMPEAEMRAHISRLHFEDEHFRVTPEERDQITKASRRSVYIGGIGMEK